MKAKSTNKFLSVALALFMLLMSVPFSMFATTVRAEETPSDGKYVLEAKNLTPFGAKTKADGDTEKAGTEKFFTLIYSSSSKIDSSSKEFSDGYSSDQRVNFGGTGSAKKNSIMFTTTAPATVKVWWVCGGDGRSIDIFDADGKAIKSTGTSVKKDDLNVSTLELEAAGQYYLGGLAGNNYIFKVEVAQQVAKSYVLEAKNLTPFGAKTKADGDTEKAGTESFFTLIYSSSSKIDSSSKEFSDGYSSDQRVNFGGTGSAKKNSIMFTTTAPATVKVWWVCGGDGRSIDIFDADGKAIKSTGTSVKKDDLNVSTLELETAGQYYLGGLAGNNYIFKVEVTTGAGKVKRSEWNTVADPEITKVEQAKDDDGNLTGEVKVTVNAVVGTDGGDQVVVTMYDEGNNEKGTATSTASDKTHELKLKPTASGTYTFKAVLSRDGEEDKVSAEKTGGFVLPLGTPVISSATSKGNGTVEVVWNEVAEATGYEVFVGGVSNGTTDKTTFMVEGLEVGKEYSITVAAIRGTEEGKPSDAKTVTTTAEAQTTWGYTMYGASVGKATYDKDGTTPTGGCGYIGDLNKDRKVTVFSLGGKGKIVPTGLDGVSYYYTAVPSDQNFTLKAKFHVDNWTYSNGQEGFGLLAIDKLAPYGEQYWTNQYMLAVTKIEYWWDEDANAVDYNKLASSTKYTNVLGVGVNTKLGVTKDNVDELNGDAKAAAKYNIAPGTNYPLDFTAAQQGLDAGSYNIVGGVTNKDAMDKAGINVLAENRDFVLELRKNNTGYFLTYYAADGKTIIGQQKFYEPDALSMVDEDNVYVGFFAARNAQVTVSDVEFKTVDPKDDDPAEERPITKIEPTVIVGSSNTANSRNYTLLVKSNVVGKADISIGGRLIKTIDIDGTDEYVAVDINIGPGTNKIEIILTPDKDQELPPYTQLSSTYPVTKNVTVEYEVYFANKNNLYVSPEGTKGGDGSKEYPLDIYTAISVVQPGQTIVIMEGTYKLETQVLIERGVDGTAKNKIYMIADPEAETRPVFDFMGTKSGMKVGGNYWYFKGFDVTNAGQKTPGMVISGNNNIVDSINAYNNTDTGIFIKALKDSSDPKSYWPSNNLILNCTSHNNSDAGMEDADGFAAKLTCGDGNVFDGCIAYNNADDGWDLYAKTNTGEIGKVTIQNCVAYKNGYLEDGTNAGNGNGFKMGGENLPGGHTIINSIAFDNKADGITCNSCPDIVVENCISCNNGGYNINLYSTAKETNFTIKGLISIRYDAPAAAAETDYQLGGAEGTADKIVLHGDQEKSGTEKYQQVYNDKYFKYDGKKTVNAADNTVLDPGKIFVSLDTASIEKNGVKRAENGKIDLGEVFKLDEVKVNAELPKYAEYLINNYRTLDGSYKTENVSENIQIKPEAESPDTTEDNGSGSSTGSTKPDRDPSPPTGFGITIVVAVIVISAAVAIVLFKKRRSSK